MNDFQTFSGFWCRVPGELPEYSLFRRKFRLNAPAELRLFVSADSRYNLYLDGRFLGRGPVRGDLEHYHYEKYELELNPGDHLLAAEVLHWNDGFQAPWSEVHYSSAFLLLGKCGGTELSTPENWSCRSDPSRRLRNWSEAWSRNNRIPIGQMEEFTAGTAVAGWNQMEYDDSNWLTPQTIAAPCLSGECKTDPPSRWKLRASAVPQMNAEPIGIAAILCNETKSVSLDGGRLSGVIPRGIHTVLLDLGKYYTHLPRFKAQGGNGTCRIAYAESLFDGEGKRTDRNPFPGGSIGENGYADLVCFAGTEMEFRPFWYRSGRFVELRFELSEPVELELSFDFLAYPLTRKRPFRSPGDPALERIMETAWHTVRCCAHEHYEDCPYWEQMQYTGDTRIQALISYIGAEDGRLGRQAIRQFDESRIASGLTMSRYPSNFRQVIPEFSLFWILMIEDYSSFFHDGEVVREHWHGIRDVLDWFDSRKTDSGLIGPVGEWNVSDWVPEWRGGRSDRGEALPETLLNLICAEACRAAADLAPLADTDGSMYAERRRALLDAVNRFCYSPDDRLYTDVPGRPWFSQHVNAWAVLAGAAGRERENGLADAVMNDSRLSQCTLYFSFYLLEMMRRLKRREDFRRLLNRWERCLEQGFTTFPECPWIDTRSDCHGWSAGPFYQILKYEQETGRRVGWKL